MREVTKDEFYKTIGKMDVCVTVQGRYPYTNIFKLRNGSVRGKIEPESAPDSPYPHYIEHYYIYE